jgi:hypothetical protein
MTTSRIGQRGRPPDWDASGTATMGHGHEHQDDGTERQRQRAEWSAAEKCAISRDLDLLVDCAVGGGIAYLLGEFQRLSEIAELESALHAPRAGGNAARHRRAACDQGAETGRRIDERRVLLLAPRRQFKQATVEGFASSMSQLELDVFSPTAQAFLASAVTPP